VAALVVITLLAMRRPIYGVAALIAVAPVSRYSDIFHTTITLSKVVLFALLLGVATRPAVFGMLREGQAKRLIAAGALAVGAIALSLTQAEHPLPALRELFKALEYVMMFAAVYVAFRLDPEQYVVEAAMKFTAIAVAVLAISQEVVGAPSGLLLNAHIIPRISGPLEGPNQLAGYFDVLVPVLLAYAIGKREPLLGVAVTLAVFADILTFSRGGQIGILAGMLVIGIIYRRNLRFALAAAGAGVVSGALVAAAWSADAHSFGLFRPFWNLSDSGYAGGVGSRAQLWRAAVRLWLQHRWLGVGAGNFEFELRDAGLRGIRTHANSLYLSSLVEGGLPLFAATCWLTFVSVAAFVRDRAESPLIAGALAASVALAIHQIVDYLTFYPKVGGTWWIVLALGAAEIARLGSRQKEMAA